ncbi:LpqB family beta-propeller domain-containing protein [Hamadaea sp. NPDC050747]|uniref:LpqB family beta-propeller domain-containing protein n=1 Tax=Hamadaea sp. NPDC050747 TaxID=3155789 RepID=UPI0033FCF3E8
MDRRTLLRLAGLGAVTGGLSACGIASHDGIVVDGAGPAPVGAASGTPVRRPTWSPGLDEKALIRDFFYQPAGDDGPEPARARCRNYLGGEMRSTWKPGNEITVVWLDQEQFDAASPISRDDSVVVRVEFYALGRLTAKGLTALPTTQLITADFWVTPRSKNGNDKVITKIEYKSGDTGDIKNTMLLSSFALSQLYDYRTLYFFSATATKELVPDARYVYKSPDGPLHRKTVELLAAGPSDWLADIVTQPLDMKLKDSPTTDDGKIVVNLSQFDIKDPDLFDPLVAQLSWALLPEVKTITTRDASPIQIKVESVVKADAGKPYKSYNAAAARHSANRLFAVADGKVRRIRLREDVDPAVTFLDGTTPNQNQGIEWAACLASKNAPEDIGALAVVRIENGRPKLITYPRTDSSSEGRQIRFGSQPEKILRPIFVDRENLLAVADGALYHVRTTVDTGPQRIVIPGISGPITAFALSPEGRRLAVIAADRLFLVALNRELEGDKISAADIRRVPTVPTNLTGVGFTGEAWLAISGLHRGNAAIIMEISLDGGLIGRSGGQFWLTYRNFPSITSLMAYPDNPDPERGGGVGRVVYTANNSAYETNTISLSADVIGPKPEGKVINPFFLE